MTGRPRPAKIVVGRGRSGELFVHSAATNPAATVQQPVTSDDSAGTRSSVAVGNTRPPSDSVPPSIRFVDTLEAYELGVAQALAHGDGAQLPVLRTRHARALGLPNGSSTVVKEPLVRGRVGGLCLTADDPVCLAAARLLTGFTARTLVQCERSRVAEELASRLAAAGTTSVTVFVPYWDPNRQTTSTGLLLDVVTTIREAIAAGLDVRCGIMTGADAGALTMAVAKTLLHRGVAERYSGRAAVMLTPDQGMGDKVLPRWNRASPDPVCVMDEDTLDVDSLEEHSFSALIFRGHGTSFCACHGYLCTARALSDDLEQAVTSCHGGLDCFERSYGRMDPREYDTAVIMLNSCNATTVDPILTRMGVPPVALHAAAASPSAVFTTHTMAYSGSELDVAAALGPADTAGDAVARLNEFFKQAHSSAIFYLLGDAELPASLWEGTRWFTTVPAVRDDRDANVDVVIDFGEKPLSRVAIAEPEGASPRLAWSAAVVTGRRPARLGSSYEFEGHSEVWLPRSSASTLGYVSLASSSELTVPLALRRHAELVRGYIRTWKSPLDENADQLVQAADQIIECGRRITRRRNLVDNSPIDRVERNVKAVVRQWQVAQEACLEPVAPQRRGKKLWPWQLWDVGTFDDAVDPSSCPSCGATPLLRHRYAVGTTARREWLECQYCQAILDRCVGTLNDATVDAPEQIVWPETVTASVKISSKSDDEMHGAALVFVNHGAPIQCEPSIFPVTVAAGETSTTTIKLSFSEELSIARRYSVVALMLLNAEPLWVSRVLFVVDEDRRAAGRLS